MLYKKITIAMCFFYDINHQIAIIGENTMKNNITIKLSHYKEIWSFLEECRIFFELEKKSYQRVWITGSAPHLMNIEEKIEKITSLQKKMSELIID